MSRELGDVTDTSEYRESIEIEDFEEADLIRTGTEEAAIDRDLLEDAIERQQARDAYIEASAETERSDHPFINSTIDELKSLFVPNRNLALHATVTRVRTADSGKDAIIIETETDDADIEETEREFRFNLETEMPELNRLLDYVGVSEPTELEGKRVPVRTKLNSTRNGTETYDVSVPQNSHGLLLKHYAARVSDRAGARTLTKKSSGYRTRYGYRLNRNTLLLWALLTAAVGVPFAAVGSALSSTIVSSIATAIFVVAGLLTTLGLLGYLLATMVFLHRVLFTPDE